MKMIVASSMENKIEKFKFNTCIVLLLASSPKAKRIYYDARQEKYKRFLNHLCELNMMHDFSFFLLAL